MMLSFHRSSIAWQSVVRGRDLNCAGGHVGAFYLHLSNAQWSYFSFEKMIDA